MSLKDLSRLFGEVSICLLGVVDKASGPRRSSPGPHLRIAFLVDNSSRIVLRSVPRISCLEICRSQPQRAVVFFPSAALVELKINRIRWIVRIVPWRHQHCRLLHAAVAPHNDWSLQKVAQGHQGNVVSPSSSLRNFHPQCEPTCWAWSREERQEISMVRSNVCDSIASQATMCKSSVASTLHRHITILAVVVA